eukprot:scaffold6072_cov87-Isochrysis_galbana.AAC.1
MACRVLLPRPPAGVGACLGSPSESLRYLCALGGDGSLTLLSPPRLLPGAAGVPPALELPRAEQRIGSPADAFGCSSDGGLLAVAGGQHISLYLIGGSGSGFGGRAAPARTPPQASLLWRVPLHCLGRSVAVARLGGAGVGSRSLVAVGCSMGLLVLTEADAAAGAHAAGPLAGGASHTESCSAGLDGGSAANSATPETAGSRRSGPRASPADACLLLRGLTVCAVALDPCQTRLAAAAVDGSIFCFRLVGRGWRGWEDAPIVDHAAHRRAAALLRPLWVVPAVGLERPCSLAFSSPCLAEAASAVHGVGAGGCGGVRMGGCGGERVGGCVDVGAGGSALGAGLSLLLVGGWLGHVAVIDCGTCTAHRDPSNHPGVEAPRCGGAAGSTLDDGQPHVDPVTPGAFGREAWRLLAVHDPPPAGPAPPPEPAPALLAACRAPHATGTVLVSPGGMAGAPLPSAASDAAAAAAAAGRVREELAAPSPVAPGRAVRAVCPLGGIPPRLPDGLRRAVAAQVRGLCVARVEASVGGGVAVGAAEEGAVRADGEGATTQAEEGAVEVVCWLDSEGALDCAPLWRWRPPVSTSAAGAPLLPRAYGGAELLATGRLHLDALPAKPSAQAAVRVWAGGRWVDLPREAGATIR